jgi:CRISPR system Cascade subunit CasC
MIADKPDWNVDAACQVAHAISTNRVSMEFDYYTAVDDLKPDEDGGLRHDRHRCSSTPRASTATAWSTWTIAALAQPTRKVGPRWSVRRWRSFVWASIRAIPTGKQNSMAAQNPPSLVLAVLRDGTAPVSLTNAFVKPAKPEADQDLVTRSIQKLGEQWGRIGAVYGDAPKVKVWADRELPEGTWAASDTVSKPAELVAWLGSSVAGQGS